MQDFKAYLIREKLALKNLPVSIRDKLPDLTSIRSNRINFKTGPNGHCYDIVVRAQNTHVTMRFAAEVIKFISGNSAMDARNVDSNTWLSIWKRSLSTYEQEFNGKKLWGLLYIDGMPVFKTHQKRIADIIEKCASVNQQRYEYNAAFVEYVLREFGWKAKVVHENSIAGMLMKDQKMIKGSINPRLGIDSSVFSYKMTGDILDTDRVYAAFCLEAIFLEAGNLCYQINEWSPLVENQKISPRNIRARQLHRAKQHLELLAREVRAIEGVYTVVYRPERPGFLK